MTFFKGKEEKPPKMKSRHLILRSLILCCALFVNAVMFNLLQLPTHLISGGNGSVAMIVEHLFHVPPATTIFVLCFALLIVSLFMLGPEKTGGAVIATFVFPLFVEWTKDIGEYIIVGNKDLILLSLFIGIFSGLTNGICYKVGFNSGGLTIISQIIYEKFKVSISKVNMIINLIVILIGSYCFGITIGLYSIIVLYVSSIVMDKVLLGISKSKTFYVITSEEEKVKSFILKELDAGVTVFNVKGGFLEKKKHVLMTVIPTRDYFKLTNGVKQIDPDSFFVVIDAYESSVKRELLNLEEITQE